MTEQPEDKRRMMEELLALLSDPTAASVTDVVDPAELEGLASRLQAVAALARREQERRRANQAFLRAVRGLFGSLRDTTVPDKPAGVGPAEAVFLTMRAAAEAAGADVTESELIAFTRVAEQIGIGYPMEEGKPAQFSNLFPTARETSRPRITGGSKKLRTGPASDELRRYNRVRKRIAGLATKGRPIPEELASELEAAKSALEAAKSPPSRRAEEWLARDSERDAASALNAGSLSHREDPCVFLRRGGRYPASAGGLMILAAQSTTAEARRRASPSCVSVIGSNGPG